MNVLDLFSGLGGWSEGFRQRGHKVIRVDFDKQFENIPDTVICDVRQFKFEEFEWDAILLSPSCGLYSVTNIGKHWTEDHQPRTPEVAENWQMVHETVKRVNSYRPAAGWVMENPRAKMRRLMEIHFENIPRYTITQCQYGKKRQKPTDLWGDFPPQFTPKPLCKPGMTCHEAQPRGSSAGSQGQGVIGAEIPLELSTAVCVAMELKLAQ